MSVPEALNSEKFAAYRESIRILYVMDDDFRTMCNDYCTSKLYIDKYQQKVQEDIQSRQDYEKLFIELEKEILTYIDKNKT